MLAVGSGLGLYQAGHRAEQARAPVLVWVTRHGTR
jgi:hypothetical protein